MATQPDHQKQHHFTKPSGMLKMPRLVRFSLYFNVSNIFQRNNLSLLEDFIFARVKSKK
jgi:hypothetical protein